MEDLSKILLHFVHMMLKPLLEKSGLSSILQMFGMAPPPPAPTPTSAHTPTTPTLTNVANPTSVAEAANKAVKGTAKSPDGKPVIGFIDVGHTLIATEIIADKTGKLVEQLISQERLNSLTYKELKEGLAKKVGEAGAITLTPGNDPGAIYNINGKKFTEAEMNFHQAISAADEFRKSGVKPFVYVRSKEDLTERAAAATKERADIFVSIHYNAFNKQANGMEIFFRDGNSDGKKLAETILTSVKEKAPDINIRGAKDVSKTQHSDLAVLKGNQNIPSILVEGGFLDNSTDQKIWIKDGLPNEITLSMFAQAISKGAQKTLEGKGYNFNETSHSQTVPTNSPPLKTPTVEIKTAQVSR
jgi:N-acetylmuramoyl-L-alanine amidase